MCIWLINQAGGLADLIAPQNDHAALEKEVAKVRTKRKLALSHSPAPNPKSQVIRYTESEPKVMVAESPAGTFLKINTKNAAGLAALLAKTDAEKK